MPGISYVYLSIVIQVKDRYVADITQPHSPVAGYPHDVHDVYSAIAVELSENTGKGHAAGDRRGVAGLISGDHRHGGMGLPQSGAPSVSTLYSRNCIATPGVVIGLPALSASRPW